MKKIISVLILTVFCFLASCAYAADIIPLSTKSIKYYGIGVLNMPKSFKVYQYPYEDAKIIKEVNYDGIRRSAIVDRMNMRNISYVAYLPSENIALLTVDYQSDNGWYSVYLNQLTGETGWVHTDDKDSFMTYRGIFYKYGKKYGIRIFNDLPEDKRVLYAKQSTDSQKLEQLTYPKYITFTVIMGNWLLATVSESNRPAKVGWFNWRNEDGTLNMFPDFKEQP